MSNLVVLLLLMNLKIVYNNDGDGWGGDKVVWTKFNLIPKPVLSNFTKSFHSVFKNSLATASPKPVISAKLNRTKVVDDHGLRNVSHEERKVPMDAITLSSKVVGFPQDRTEPPKIHVPTSAPEVVPRRRRRPVIRYEEEEADDDDEDDDEDITDELVDVDDDDDDDDEDEEEEVEEVVEEVPDSSIGVKHEYEDDHYVEPITIKKTKRIKKKSKKYLKLKDFKKLKRFMLPLLLAYKLKFFTLIPLLLGGLVLIVGTTGFAGFFFALFAVGLGLQKNHHG